MTPTLEIPNAAIPARRRPSAPLPVLIRVPKLDSEFPRGPRRPRRRRLRREFRVVACVLLVTLPLAMACVTLGLGPMSRPKPPAETESEADPSAWIAPGISLAPPEPIVAVNDLAPIATAPLVRPEPVAPVSLGVELLPVDEAEEGRDGGH